MVKTHNIQRWQRTLRGLFGLCVMLLWTPATLAAFTLEAVRDYAFPSQLVTASAGEASAWVVNHRGRENVWWLETPVATPKQISAYLDDDGQVISRLQISRDGRRLLWLRGGEPGGGWDQERPSNPASAPSGQTLGIWTALAGKAPLLLAEGTAPVLSPDGARVAFVKGGEVWAVGTAGGTPERLFTTRGTLGSLAWSEDGQQLAFVTKRGQHALIGVYRGPTQPLRWIAPSFARDAMPRWSPDGRQLLFARRLLGDGAPRDLVNAPRPWEIWVADVDSGKATRRWASGMAMRDSLPHSAWLEWGADGAIVFTSYHTGWLQIHALDAGQSVAQNLTPGEFQVEDIALSRDRRQVYYSANTGPDRDDRERRHLYKVAVAGGAAQALTTGTGLEWSPRELPDGRMLLLSSTARRPPLPTLRQADGTLSLLIQPVDGFPLTQLVVPQSVHFRAEDGVEVYAQLFRPSGVNTGTPRPAVLFVHGGPQRQMLLGWHNMDYYANAWAINQYLVSQGYLVLSVNYRLGPGYGHDFHYPADASAWGAAEYRDVLAAGRYLQSLPEVDAGRIGIYGGSYGGYLTALALARDSDLFKVGVDLHGVHDWTRLQYADQFTRHAHEGDQAAAERFLHLAWASSPMSAIAGWRSPVLLIHGDDDRNVEVGQSIELAHRLRRAGVPHEVMLVVDENHHWSRYAHQLQVNAATVAFLQRHLGTP